MTNSERKEIKRSIELINKVIARGIWSEVERLEVELALAGISYDLVGTPYRLASRDRIVDGSIKCEYYMEGR